MKQAILITGYKNLNQLSSLIDFFDDDFHFYIHVDAKTKSADHILSALNEKKQVRVISRKYSVNWGGRNHLLAILELCRLAAKDQENDYFHLITGEDYPIKSVDAFKNKFSAEKTKEFLMHIPLTKSAWPNQGKDRLMRYNFFDLLNAKAASGARWIRRLQRYQDKLNLKRSAKGLIETMYGGSTYWSLTKNGLQTVMDYTEEHPSFLKRLKHTFCAEEVYFQSILLNSPLANQVENSNLRFIDWGEHKTTSPLTLNEEHYEILLQSDCFFARKINANTSSLIEKINDRFKS